MKAFSPALPGRSILNGPANGQCEAANLRPWTSPDPAGSSSTGVCNSGSLKSLFRLGLMASLSSRQLRLSLLTTYGRCGYELPSTISTWREPLARDSKPSPAPTMRDMVGRYRTRRQLAWFRYRRRCLPLMLFTEQCWLGSMSRRLKESAPSVTR